jgi:hypothetical protein
MTSFTEDGIARLRASLAQANPDLSQERLEKVLAGLLRQGEDTEDHDRSLIAERMSWTPEQRLKSLEAFLAFVERARTTSPR